MDDVVTSRFRPTEGLTEKPARARTPSAETALLGVYEISKILTAPARLEQTLANVVSVLSSFLDMKLGMITILDQHGDPEIVATSGWIDAGKPIDTLPAKVIDRLVATAVPVIVEDVSNDPLFATAAERITQALGSKSPSLPSRSRATAASSALCRSIAHGKNSSPTHSTPTCAF